LLGLAIVTPDSHSRALREIRAIKAEDAVVFDAEALVVISLR
jgi:hypothetical protein